jgi:hypothetical protein
MGILEISKEPAQTGADFFIENSLNLDMANMTNYYDLLNPSIHTAVWLLPMG